MECSWLAVYVPALVTIDEARGGELGIRVSVTSDWDDAFDVEAVPRNGYQTLAEWCRATDGRRLPDYFFDFLSDLATIVVDRGLPAGVHQFSVDLALREGLQTARDRWDFENPFG
jgi:hypothetical protein